MASRAEYERTRLDCAVLEARLARIKDKLERAVEVMEAWERPLCLARERVAALRQRIRQTGGWDPWA